MPGDMHVPELTYRPVTGCLLFVFFCKELPSTSALLTHPTGGACVPLHDADEQTPSEYGEVLWGGGGLRAGAPVTHHDQQVDDVDIPVAVRVTHA